MSDKSERYAHRILDVAMGLHGSACGQCDPLPEEAETDLVDWLRMRLRNWHPSSDKWRAFDDAVRAVAVAAIREVEAERYVPERLIADPDPDGKFARRDRERR